MNKQISLKYKLVFGSVTLAVTGALIAANSYDYEPLGIFFVGVAFAGFILSLITSE